MASPQQLAWLQTAYDAAKAANHPWPDAAACEAAEETGWGEDTPPNSFNVLGIKAYRGWTGPTVGAPGTEQNPDGSWTGPQADVWCVFASMSDCFAEQVRILQEPRYAAAMAATDAPSYIQAECIVWSTSQSKADTVLAIWKAHAAGLVKR